MVSIDVGNSTVDCLDHDQSCRARFDLRGGDLSEVVRFARNAGARRVVLATVHGDQGGTVAAALREAGIAVAVAGHDLSCPLVLDYEPPESLGCDRWLGALAAFRAVGASVVVDCGSATTVNAVDARGVFRGGPIGPGLRALTAGMLVVTPALPVPERPPATSSAWSEELPRTSLAALVQCQWLGYAGLVERLAAATLAALGPPATLWITGGNADAVCCVAGLEFRRADDLVHQGLRCLAEQGPCGS
jgi:type III pantothenate kinase